MIGLDTVPGSFGHRVLQAGIWRALLLSLCLSLVFGLLGSRSAQAQAIELSSIKLSRESGGLALDFDVKFELSRAVEDALQRGVPLYFTAQAQVYRPRWYWRDERVARATRTWRVSYQPLTSSWRVSFGALSQSFPSAESALATVSRSAGWAIAEAEQIDGDSRYYVEFSYKLDSSLLPRPMQLDLAAQADWRLSVDRTLKVD